MKAIEVNTDFDENGKLNLKEIPALKNKKARLLILIDEHENDSDLYNLSELGLSKAYAQDEPEYDLSLVKELNPKYVGR